MFNRESMKIGNQSIKVCCESLRSCAKASSSSTATTTSAHTLANGAIAMLAANAKFLNAHVSSKVRLEGHTDERGSREYNIALGQKRADAVKRMMTLMGVQEVIVETVSFGKEKPRERCHEEKCWAENRRADFVDAWK